VVEMATAARFEPCAEVGTQADALTEAAHDSVDETPDWLTEQETHLRSIWENPQCQNFNCQD
jgi:hypothetical protein